MSKNLVSAPSLAACQERWSRLRSKPRVGLAMSIRFERCLKTSVLSAAVAVGLSSGTASAQIIPDPTPTKASVSSVVTQIGSDSWKYELTIHNESVSNGSPGLEAYPWAYWLLIPYFSDAGITNITCPATCKNGSEESGWYWHIDTGSSISYPFGGQGYPGWAALSWDWYADDDAPGVALGQSLPGFGFSASYAPVKGPFLLRFALGSDVLGDPAIPGSPLAQAAGYATPFEVTGVVPEASTYAMMLAGLGLLGFMARRRKQQSAA